MSVAFTPLLQKIGLDVTLQWRYSRLNKQSFCFYRRRTVSYERSTKNKITFFKRWKYGSAIETEKEIISTHHVNDIHKIITFSQKLTTKNQHVSQPEFTTEICKTPGNILYQEILNLHWLLRLQSDTRSLGLDHNPHHL